MKIKTMITEIFEKKIEDVYETSIIQQTAFWSEVKRKLGMNTTAIDFKVKKNEISGDPHEKGSMNCDMFGVAPAPDPGHPLYGLYRFKSGFGGKMFHSLGCWDYPFKLEKNNA